MIGRSNVRPLASLSMLAGSIALACAPARAGQNDDMPRPRFADFKDMQKDLSRREARDLFEGGRDLVRNQRQITRMQLRADSSRSADTHKEMMSQTNLLNLPKLNNLKQSIQINDRGKTVGMRSGVDIDLGSTDANIVLGAKLMSTAGALTINVGGTAKQVAAGDQVTAAEYIAVKQMLASGKQDIGLDSSGRAVGGEFDLSQITSKHDQIRADDFVIPENVVGYGDFGRRATFQIEGDLTNAGSLIARSYATRGNASFDLGADSITNKNGALISAQSGVHTFAPDGSTVDLELSARDFIENAGTISSSGNLTLTAGNVVKNDGGTITATGDVLISSH
ncbi:MAG: hypothetical protein SGJ27_21445 [Candidatus Melainabacteria bacterium]|nr:hypothetical protein [Candidatus Melainabacteria bacterium]